MSAVDDVRKVIQDLVAPDLKAIAAKLETVDITSKLRDDALSAKIDNVASESKLRDDALAIGMDIHFKMVLARMDAQHATVMNALSIDKRLDALERSREAQPHTS